MLLFWSFAFEFMTNVLQQKVLVTVTAAKQNLSTISKMWTSQDAVSNLCKPFKTVFYHGEKGSKEVERRRLMTSRGTVVFASPPALSVICLHALS